MATLRSWHRKATPRAGLALLRCRFGSASRLAPRCRPGLVFTHRPGRFAVTPATLHPRARPRKRICANCRTRPLVGFLTYPPFDRYSDLGMRPIQVPSPGEIGLGQTLSGGTSHGGSPRPTEPNPGGQGRGAAPFTTESRSALADRRREELIKLRPADGIGREPPELAAVRAG